MLQSLPQLFGYIFCRNRPVTNGGGDRSINFSQLRSELFNKIAIYMTQSASLIEGGVAGQIQLSTVRPIDPFKLGSGEIAISLGYSRNTATNPEQEARISDTINYCRNDPTSTTDGVGDDNNCDTGNLRPSVARAEDFVVGRSRYTFRQNITDDTRDSFFCAVQMKPNSDVDVNIDFQYSNRVYRARRNDLVFSEGRRIDDVNDALST